MESEVSTEESTATSSQRNWIQDLKTSEDWWAIWCAAIILVVSFVGVMTTVTRQESTVEGETATVVEAENPFKDYVAKPAKWDQNPVEAFYKVSDNGDVTNSALGLIGVFVVISLVFTFAMWFRGESGSAFAKAFPVVFLLATLAYLLAGQSVVKAYNLEYALWALGIGMVISNTVGTPSFLKPAVQTEFYIKTGLVLLGAEVLVSRLLALGIPGVFVAWVVTPIVLISTYAFGQKVLKIPSRSLNMVISADMSVCGVSAAIATAASCKAKKEELSLAIGLSLSFTVIMMVVMPTVIGWIGMDEVLAGAWMGGTIDSTGAVALAGEVLGDTARDTATTIKMIQNILIGVTAFFVALYWVAKVERDPSGPRPSGKEIWRRFPKFVLGFVIASIVFSILHASLPGGVEIVNAVTKGSTKTFRGWFFCLAFVSIGLATNFRELAPYLKGGKPMLLYICGQTLNLCLTLFMAWLMFEVVFADMVSGIE